LTTPAVIDMSQLFKTPNGNLMDLMTQTKKIIKMNIWFR